MPAFRCKGQQAFSGSAPEQPELCERWLGFMAQNICAYRLEKGIPEGSRLEIQARSRFAGGSLWPDLSLRPVVRA
jgi:hypothetical protein